MRVTSLIPYRATVRSPEAALLETPRMFVPGYAATVNGAPVAVRKSAEGLVAFPVPQGESRVELRFAGPLALAPGILAERRRLARRRPLGGGARVRAPAQEASLAPVRVDSNPLSVRYF